jgi:hypothetical protein
VASVALIAVAFAAWQDRPLASEPKPAGAAPATRAGPALTALPPAPPAAGAAATPRTSAQTTRFGPAPDRSQRVPHPFQ